MKCDPCNIESAFVVSHPLFEDERGFFKEIFRANLFEEVIKPYRLLQENHSYSKLGVMRGLHYQREKPQAQLITVFSGTIYQVLVDLRRRSKTFGNVFEVRLSSTSPKCQIFMPPGVAGGFLALTDKVHLNYKVSEYFDKDVERGLNCFDPELAISWPKMEYKLNQRDRDFPNLSGISDHDLPIVL